MFPVALPSFVCFDYLTVLQSVRFPWVKRWLRSETLLKTQNVQFRAPFYMRPVYNKKQQIQVNLL